MQKKSSEQRSSTPVSISARLNDFVRRASADCPDDEGNVLIGAHFTLRKETPRQRWFDSRITLGGRQLQLSYSAFGAYYQQEFVYIECTYVSEPGRLTPPRLFMCTCSNEMPWTSIESILWDAVGWLDSDGVRFGK